MKWGIIGGGILGLTLARELARAGEKVVLHEAAPECGGLASAWQIGEYTWDKFYHVTLLSDGATRGLLTDLGLEQDMRWVETRTGFFTDERLYSLSTSLEFLRFPPLGLIDKLRLGGTIFYASRVQDWQALEQIPVADWLTKLSGKRTFEKIWRPLLRAKLGDQYERASAAFIWATISRMYAARRAGLKREMFGYLPGGYGRLLAGFAEQLRHEGVTIRLASRVKAVRQVEDGLVATFGEGSAEQYDRVVLTTPMSAAAAVCPDLTLAEREAFQAVPYHGIVCCSLLLNRPLAGFYVTNITDEQIPFTGLIEMTALVDREQFGGRTLVYLPRYLPSGDAGFDVPDEVLRAQAVAALRRMYPDFAEDQIEAFQVARARQVFASPVLDYSRRLPPVTTSVPGLHVWNSAHIVNGTLNVNDTIQLAQRGARELLATRLKRPAAQPVTCV